MPTISSGGGRFRVKGRKRYGDILETRGIDDNDDEGF